MKTTFKNIHVYLFILLTGSMFTACKEKDNPAPDLAASTTGIYRYSSLGYNGKEIPAEQTDLEGDIRIVRRTATTINAELAIHLRSTGEDYMVYDVEDVELEQNDDEIKLIYDGERVATIRGKKLIIDGEDVDGTPFTITAVK